MTSLPLRSMMAFMFASLMLAGFAACRTGSDAKRSGPEEVFVVRPYHSESGGRWIGNAVCYGPHRNGQSPGGSSPSAAELREDLHLMAPRWNLLRIYGSSGFADTMLSVIHQDGMDLKVMLGAWIAPHDDVANQRELEAAARLAAAYPKIVTSICVGNETQVSWSAHRSPLDELIGYVREVRARAAVPVTTADDFAFWKLPESRTLAAELDFVAMHAHPMWNGRQRDEALPWLREQVAAVQAMHPDRTVVLGETGWATMVHNEGEQAQLIKGQPGEAEQKIFYDDIRAWAEAERLTVFFFEAFDENWKGGAHPDEVEKHWGVFRADRSPKQAVAPAANGS